MCSETWRLPFGQSGILDFFLHLLTVEKEDADLVAPSLRLIGNACADTGLLHPCAKFENRF